MARVAENGENLMICGRCEPDYCACHDFFLSFREFHSGKYAHLQGNDVRECAWLPYCGLGAKPLGTGHRLVQIERRNGDREIGKGQELVWSGVKQWRYYAGQSD